MMVFISFICGFIDLLSWRLADFKRYLYTNSSSSLCCGSYCTSSAVSGGIGKLFFFFSSMQVTVQNRKSVRLGQFLSPKILVIPFLRWITALSHLSVALFWLGGEEFSHPQIFQSSPHQKSSNGLHPNNLRAESPEPGATGLLLGTRFSPLAGWIFPSSTLACFCICSLCFSLSSRAMVVAALEITWWWLQDWFYWTKFWFQSMIECLCAW